MIDLVFRKRVGIVLMYALLCVCGIVLVGRLPVQLYPRTDRPRLMTSFRHEGYSAIGFSEEFGDLIEPRLLSLDGVDLLEARYGRLHGDFRSFQISNLPDHDDIRVLAKNGPQPGGKGNSGFGVDLGLPD